LKFIIAGGIIVGAVCYLMFSGIGDSMVYYYTVSELTAQARDVAGKGVRVSGYVAPGSVGRAPGRSELRFLVFEKGSPKTLPVVYGGIVPDTFKPNAEVVVEGVYRPEEGVFYATTLLAKCPSKYESKGAEHPDDVSIR
jgi:cytochrome c-type biogenesis protein CcmE